MEINEKVNENINKPDNVEKEVVIVRAEGLDKFYTIPAIAEKCIVNVGAKYDWNKWCLVVEPSAGNGSFLSRIPCDKKIGIDIAPEHKDIIKQDFLTYSPPENVMKLRNAIDNNVNVNNGILVIGNPPFGRVSSLAIKFFNHATTFADVIAFIIPKTFRRISVHNKLNKQFHLVFDEDIPMEPCSFNPPMMVKCCFQIWERQVVPREVIDLPTIHTDWSFLSLGPKDEKDQPTPPIGADFVIRAYGGRCGEIKENGLELLRPKSWHWIKSNIDKQVLINRFKALDYKVSLNTARQNSIGRGELVALYISVHDKK